MVRRESGAVKTFKDGEGVVHEVEFAFDHASRYHLHRSRCGAFDDIHRGDVYQMHRRPVTCLLCSTAVPRDVD